MANQTIVIEQSTYVIAPLKFGEGRELFSTESKLADLNGPLLRMSLNNADGGTRTDADIDALPYPHAMQLIPACLEINGLHRPKAADAGEEQPAKAAAE